MKHGNIEFFTATCLNWQNLLEDLKHKEIILDSLVFLVHEQRIWLYGYVIMPNHIHIIWRKQDNWIEKNVQQQFLKFTAQQIKFNFLDNNLSQLINYKSTQFDRKFHFWERRPFKARNYTREIIEQKLDYIHFNPVKAGLCMFPEDYLFSSAPFYYQKSRNPILTHYMDHL